MPEDWRQGAVLYQIYPRSFQDTTGNGVGDLPGIYSRLPYIADLGVDGIWISPFFRSPMFDHGYDVSDHRAIDPVFGHMRDVEDLVSACHRLGLKLVIDQVYSHSSDQHAWFRESRRSRSNEKADWYVWANPRPDGSPPCNWAAWFHQTAWTWAPERQQYYLSNFHPRMPDLNFHCEAVQQATLETMRFWLDLGVDGFRLDTSNFYFHDTSFQSNPPSDTPDPGIPAEHQRHIHNICQPENLGFLERMRSVADEYGPILLQGEIASDNDAERVVEYTQAGRLDTAYSFLFLRALRDVPDFAETYQSLFEDGEQGWPTLSFSNHDVPRVATRWGGESSDDFCFAHVALLVCLRGNACLYQGEELGLPQASLKAKQRQDPVSRHSWPPDASRDGCRTPMPWESDHPYLGFSSVEPWLPPDEDHALRAVNLQERHPESLLHRVRTLLNWRGGIETLQRGTYELVRAADAILAFERRSGSETWLCVFNLGREAAEFNLPDGYGACGSHAPWHGPLEFPDSLDVPAWGVRLYQMVGRT